ncbi:MAG TPA: ankyrin repeat domain-containing protein [Acidobacteriota bacterium]|nr:ankyrin repeat domain-containing protein [Acidobacteriota bacterium]
MGPAHSPTGTAGRGTPLTAINKKNISMVEFLLNHGADPNRAGSGDATPLWKAIRDENNSIFEFLLNHGADPNRPDSHGDTPLRMAAGWRKKSMVESLLKHGADPNLPGYGGYYPLDGAVSNKEIKSILINAGATKRKP